jgi:hypothetical protein
MRRKFDFELAIQNRMSATSARASGVPAKTARMRGRNTYSAKYASCGPAGVAGKTNFASPRVTAGF